MRGLVVFNDTVEGPEIREFLCTMEGGFFRRQFTETIVVPMPRIQIYTPVPQRGGGGGGGGARLFKVKAVNEVGETRL